MIQQNTPEWLELRKSKIGASDAPVIMGDSPWTTPYQLWLEKTGQSEGRPQNYAMRRGHEMEPIARDYFQRATGMWFEPEVVISSERDWMMASLDGISLGGGELLEIKNPGVEDHEEAKKGRVPKKYVAQNQHALCASGGNLLYYFSYRSPEDTATVEVKPDLEYIEKLLAAEEEFMRCVKEGTPPPQTDRDYLPRADREWIEVCEKWKAAKAAAEEEEFYRKELIRLSAGKSSQGGGVRLRKGTRAGSVQYKKIPELVGVDLDKYRTAPLETWRLECI